MSTGILGGGITGLTLGCFLNDSSAILEGNIETGGLCRSLSCGGFTFDYGGSHIVFSKDTEAMNFMLSALGDNKVKNRRNTKILFKGSFVKYPFENGLSDLPLEDNYECLQKYIECNLKKARGEVRRPENFKEWMYYTFGQGITEKYMLPYNEKIWNYNAELMNVEWVDGRVPEPPINDVIKASLGLPTEGYMHQLFFYYPETGGIQSLIKGIEKKYKGDVITGFKVQKIYREGTKWTLSDGKESLKFDRLISTIPLHELITTLKNLPSDVINAVKSLKYNSLITIMIGIKKSPINDISWLYVPSPDDGLFNRLSFPSNFSINVVPEGMSSVMAEITCNINDKVWSTSDDEIIKRTEEDLYKLNIINKEDVCYAKAWRSKYAYIIYDLDYLNNMRTISNYFSSIGIFLCGRFSEFKYLNMDACVRSAMNMAIKLNDE